MEEIVKKKCTPLNLFELVLNRIAVLILHWKPDQEDTAVEKAATNMKLALSSIVQMKWRKKRNCQKDFDQMVKFLQQLDQELLDQLFDRFINYEMCSPSHHPAYIQAGHIALFIHHEITQLTLSFTSKRFDFHYLLRLCGHMMENLEELKLPKSCHLPTSVCEQMCQMVPKLRILDLTEVKIEDDAMKYICNLDVRELYLSKITDRGVDILCSDDSYCKFSLQVLHITTNKISVKYQCLILQKMPSLESLNLLNFKLDLLSDEYKLQPLNLRQLKYFQGTSVDIEKDLEIATFACPAMSKLIFEHEVLPFSPRVLLLLSKLEFLSILSLEGCHFDDLFEIEMRWILPKLVDLTIGYYGCNFSSGHFFSLLEMCPNLEKLKVSTCEGFNDRIANQTSHHLTDKNIIELNFLYCDLLRPPGIGVLLKLPTLKKCTVKYSTLKLDDVDNDDLQELNMIACESGVNLDVRLKNSIVLVLVQCNNL